MTHNHNFVIIFVIVSSLSFSAEGYNLKRNGDRIRRDTNNATNANNTLVSQTSTTTEEPEPEGVEIAEPLRKPEHYESIVKKEMDNKKIETEVNEEVQVLKGRGATNVKEKHWEYKMILVIDPNFSAESRETILSAVYTLNEALKECFEFYVVKKGSIVSNKKDHLFIKKEGKGCYSYLGRQKGQQVTILADGCNLYGTTMHEIMHVLGFYHEHVRPDRDRYVTVAWNEAKTDVLKNQYVIRKDQTTFASEYDFDSIMHYPMGKILQPKSGKMPPDAHPGQRNHLSKRDIVRLQGLYPCSKKPR